MHLNRPFNGVLGGPCAVGQLSSTGLRLSGPRRRSSVILSRDQHPHSPAPLRTHRRGGCGRQLPLGCSSRSRSNVARARGRAGQSHSVPSSPGRQSRPLQAGTLSRALPGVSGGMGLPASQPAGAVELQLHSEPTTHCSTPQPLTKTLRITQEDLDGMRALKKAAHGGNGRRERAGDGGAKLRCEGRPSKTGRCADGKRGPVGRKEEREEIRATRGRAARGRTRRGKSTPPRARRLGAARAHAERTVSRAAAPAPRCARRYEAICGFEGGGGAVMKGWGG
jgi:hypothetical protein